MDDFISTMVWQLFFLIRHKLDNFLYFGVLSFCICLADGLDYQWQAGRSIWIDWVCVQVHCAVQVQAEGNQMKWTTGPFWKERDNDVGLNDDLSGAVRER